MNIFVTGGTGFLGYYTIRRLLSSGHHVFALTRQPKTVLSDLQSELLTVVQGSLENMADLPVLPVDICLHFAWGGVNRVGVNDHDTQRQNVYNTINLVKYIRQCQCKMLVDTGSRQEYAPIEGIITEESECTPPSEYGKWKLESFHQTLSMVGDMRYVHLRIFSTYGYGDHPWSLINTSIEKCLKGEPISLGRCRHYWSYLYIDDFTDAISEIIAKCSQLDENKVYNLASGYIQPLQYFVNTIHWLTASSSELLYGTRPETEVSTRSLIPDISRINREIGWYEKVSFPQVIKMILSK